MRTYLSLIVIVWCSSCSPQTKNETLDSKFSNSINKSQDNQTSQPSELIDIKQDSLIISQSNEYSRLIKFLNWYKAGHDKLYMPRIEKRFSSYTSFYAYVDTLAATELLLLYRESGYFTKDYLENDSLYIEKAKKAYLQKDIKIYDYFDHDFILLTQEVKETLEAIPNTYILADHTDLGSRKIAVSIGGYMNLRFMFKNENNQLRIDRIENLGLLN